MNIWDKTKLTYWEYISYDKLNGPYSIYIYIYVICVCVYVCVCVCVCVWWVGAAEHVSVCFRAYIYTRKYTY